jgi:SprT protein
MSRAPEALSARIVRRTRQLLERCAPLCAAHGVALPDPQIRLDLRGQAAGQARWDAAGRPLLRYNLHIARRHADAFLARTVPHEVAHLITAACHGRTRPHGPEWRRVMAHLGITNPSRCHDYQVDESQVKRQRRWTYRCDCRHHQLSTTRHKRALAGSALYHCRACHAALRYHGAECD